MTKSQAMIAELADFVESLDDAIHIAETGVTGDEKIDGDVVKTLRAHAYEKLKAKILKIRDRSRDAPE